ncbi:copper chaperone PCu(A)C [Streptomyces sp. G44]|uniref:copper chaperone PCu(A)C n=1 Tax=Streptomyces sp. G44 TaxID=2807632 RepID=UPI00195F2F7D|nr:copper chaperone PCu(A)C [Streptomyces sp. G44]MBM7169804.1 copper chaperone PCu(A)C [Streptomyces sp. G44]
MSRSLRRGALAATAIAFSLASLAACGAGNNAQTLGVRPDNAATSVGDIKIQNAMVITQPDLKAKGPAVVSATIFNGGTTDQTLDSITVKGADEKVKITPAKDDKAAAKNGRLTIPAGGSVVIGGKDNASAVLPSGREAVKDGDAQQVTFAFDKTGDVKLEAFVVPAESYFTTWGPTEVPQAPGAEASAKPGQSGKPGQSAKPGASGEPATGASTDPSGHASDAAGADPSDAASHGADTGTGTEH